MATKGKSGPKKAKKKHRFEDAADEQLANARETMTETATETSPESYVNQWNQLVSTTNWEKGRIICQWREALIADGAPQADYSDEAWANLVGGVTGQHVGRLRRVHQQFGQVWTEYPGLFWSHFQVAMDWNDAEMWLEGCVQNGWSVSRMRGARWEAHGAPDDLKPSDDDVIVAGMDEDVVAAPNDDTAMAAVRDPSGSDTDDAESEDAESSSESPTSAKRNKADAESAGPKQPRVKPFAGLPELPDDVAEAFEQFKLVILAHKLTGWQEISRDDLLATLDALKELAKLPADE
jgi:hypothetical protein